MVNTHASCMLMSLATTHAHNKKQLPPESHQKSCPCLCVLVAGRDILYTRQPSNQMTVNVHSPTHTTQHLYTESALSKSHMPHPIRNRHMRSSPVTSISRSSHKLTQTHTHTHPHTTHPHQHSTCNSALLAIQTVAGILHSMAAVIPCPCYTLPFLRCPPAS